jgi:nucleotide-binding universal stress UspA family protein
VRKILAATDGSEAGTRSVAFAAELARRFGAALDVLTVVRGSGEILMGFTHTSGKEADEAVERIGRVHLERSLTQVDLEGIPVHSAIRVGAPAVELEIYAENTKPDLLVIGGNGRVAQHVVAHAPCPVTVLP